MTSPPIRTTIDAVVNDMQRDGVSAVDVRELNLGITTASLERLRHELVMAQSSYGPM